MNENPPEIDSEKEKWNFDDYAFTITGIIVGFFMIVPGILYSRFGISILGAEILHQLRALSPWLFLLTATICFFKDAFDARKSGGYTDSWFTHDFDSLFEFSIYLALATITVFSTILIGAMWASWLAAPISWILFVFILPFMKKRNSADKIYIPWLCLFIFVAGIIVEVITGAWIAFPLSWLVICVIKFIGYIRKAESSLDTVYDISYSTLSVIAMAAGIFLNFWIISWSPILIALFVCWIFSKFKRLKKVSNISE